MKIKINPNSIDAFASRLFYLAWQACGGPMGMGVFQNRPQATEQEVFNNVLTHGDYPGNHNSYSEVYGDYVFGRMMKFGFSMEDGLLVFRDSPFAPDYQGFSRKYKTLQSLLDATSESIGIPYEVVA